MNEFKQKGWKNPGYHYTVFPDGKIEQLLPESEVSNGVQGYNSTSINVCYIGGVDKQGRPIDNRTDAQKASLIAIIKELKTRYPDAVIMGHREIWGSSPKNWKKMCPCFNAGEEYKDILKEKPKPTFQDIGKPTDYPKPEPIQIPTEPIVSEEQIQGPNADATWEEDKTPIAKQQSRPSVLGFIVKLITSIFRK